MEYFIYGSLVLFSLIVGIILILIIAIFCRLIKQNIDFRKNVKSGDYCHFYWGQDKLYGKVLTIGVIMSTIESSGQTYYVLTDDLYPSLIERYDNANSN